MKETCSFCRSLSLSKESESINEIKKNHEMVGDYDGNDGGDLFCAAVGKSGGKRLKFLPSAQFIKGTITIMPT
jgi:hypothetical protein